MADTISLDLRTGLQMIPDDISAGVCVYTAPCVVGMMMTPEQRLALDDRGYNARSIGFLMGRIGTPSLKVDVPADQQDDMETLQDLYDAGNSEALRQQVASLKEKYHVQAG